MAFDLEPILGKMNILSSEYSSIVSMNLFVALLCACIVIGHLLEENRWMNESITALLIGLCTGFVILLTSGGKSSHLLVFSEDLFFIYLLPPIIFNAGFVACAVSILSFVLWRKLLFLAPTSVMEPCENNGNVATSSQWAVTCLMCAIMLLFGTYLSTLLFMDMMVYLGVYTIIFDFAKLFHNIKHHFSRFQVKKKQFFRNFMTIMLFGAIGTFISFTIISLGAINLFKRMNIGDLQLGDFLAIGAIFAATDSVCTLQVLNQDETPLLYSLVFGEGVVNDATSVVLFNAIQNFDLSHIDTTTALQLIGNFFYLFISSTVLGAVAGLLSAYIIKKLYFGRHSTDREVAIMILMAYLSYILAELLDLSGILTVFFCGIVMSHYTWHNVTESSRITTKHSFATLSFIAEIFIFLYVGMDALDIEKWSFVADSPGTSIGVSSILLGLTMVGRAAFVFPLSFLSNLTKKEPYDKIDFKQQILIWWSGLMRGAVSMALAYKQFARLGYAQLRQNAVMITSTISVVLFSTMVFGLLTKPLVQLLLPSPKHLTRMLSTDSNTPKSFIVPLLSNGGLDSEADLEHNVPRPTSLRMLLSTPSHTVHRYWRKFDNAFMRPMFGGRGFVPFVPGSPTERSVHILPTSEETS